MPLVETKGAASAQGFGQFARVAAPVYIEDVMSVFLYTGNGSTQTITNGIDLAGKGGLVWLKNRATGPAGSSPFTASDNSFYDTARGAQKFLSSNSTGAQADFGVSGGLQSFTSTGFSVKDTSAGEYGANGSFFQNSSPALTYASWTFRKQAKFFDVVTYTGDGTNNRAIAHSLGSTPGFIVIKRTDAADGWWCYHRSMTSTNYYMRLDGTGAEINLGSQWIAVGSTTFSVWNSGLTCNVNGGTYVAYLFAHDAGGFGQSGSDNVVSCGSFTGDAQISLGWEPQFLLVKPSSTTGSWQIFDSMRGWTTDGNVANILANLANAENATTTPFRPNATGFKPSLSVSDTYIYIAIRRGPMKTPTTGTSVFQPVVYTGTNVDNRLVDMSLLTDMVFVRQRDDTVLGGMVVGDRLRGDPYLLTGTTAAEVSDADSFMTPTSGVGNSWSAMNGFGVGNDATSKLNASTTSNNQIAEGFRRAPGFFDVVCFTKDATVNQRINHNLAAVPELIICKMRNAGDAWYVYTQTGGISKYLIVNDIGAQLTYTNAWGSSGPTTTDFGTNKDLLLSGYNYVAYLFATCPGVSKVGSYTGTGNVLQIDCGFTGGARFVLIKRTDSTGDWYVWDSARGIVAGNDPYLLLNSTVAEVTTTDWVDTYSAGFELSNAGGNNANINTATYIFLAIA